jgi:DNA replication protein DnaC
MALDEIGYLPISRMGTQLFLQLMSRRYERASTMLNGNKSKDEWGDVRRVKSMAAALIDGMPHHCRTVNVSGNSCCMREHRAIVSRLAPPVLPEASGAPVRNHVSRRQVA